MKAYGFTPIDLEYGLPSKYKRLKSKNRQSVRRSFAKKIRQEIKRKINKCWADA